MGKPFLSRHFLAEQASCLAGIPFAAAGAAEEGVATTHNLLALGTWCQDAQVGGWVGGLVGGACRGSREQ